MDKKVNAKSIKSGTTVLFIFAFLFLLALSGFSSFGPLCSAQNSQFQSIVYFLMIPVVFLIALIVKENKFFETKDLLIFVGGGLAIISLVNLISTIMNYGFFHTLIWKDTPIYYYEGTPYDITKEAMSLIGVSLKETSIEYSALFPFLSSTYILGIFFIDSKKDKARFSVSLVIGLIGLLSLIAIGYWIPLCLLAFIIATTLIYKLGWKRPKLFWFIKFLIWFLFGVAVLFCAIVLLNAYNEFKFDGISEKIFESNFIMSKVTEVLKGSFYKDGSNGYINLLGFTSEYALETSPDVLSIDSGMFEVEIIKEAGLPGLLLIFILIWISIKELNRFVIYGNDDNFSKVTLTMLITGFFIYNTLFYDGTFYTHESGYTPVLRSSMTLILFILLGLIFAFDLKEEKHA